MAISAFIFRHEMFPSGPSSQRNTVSSVLAADIAHDGTFCESAPLMDLAAYISATACLVY